MERVVVAIIALFFGAIAVYSVRAEHPSIIRAVVCFMLCLLIGFVGFHKESKG